MNVKHVLKRIVYGYRADSETYVKWLRQKGVIVGEHVNFISPRSGWVDISRPWMVRIGNCVTVTAGVTILSHDYSWSVIKACSGEIMGGVGHVIIGDNVFIGTQSTVLGGVTIGNNVIIGANSLVSKDIPDNAVAAGNPAKVICTLAEFSEKRKKKFVNEAKDMAKMYYRRYAKWPEKNLFTENFWVFEDSYDSLNHLFREVFYWVDGDENRTKEKFHEYVSAFESYEAFIHQCERELKTEGV